MIKTFLRRALPWLSILLILCLLTACDGGKQPPADSHMGADVNRDGVPQCISNIKVTEVTLYVGGISAEQAKALFAESEVPAE